MIECATFGNVKHIVQDYLSLGLKVENDGKSPTRRRLSAVSREGNLILPPGYFVERCVFFSSFLT